MDFEDVFCIGMNYDQLLDDNNDNNDNDNNEDDNNEDDTASEDAEK
jgi:hypothetical protein